MGDNALSRLRRKLEQAELEHLRSHCSVLADRLEKAEERATVAEEQADYYWQENLNLLHSLHDQGETIGLTREGELGIVAKPALPTVPELAAGETYVATVIDAAEGKGYHLILLPGDNDGASWQAQIEWAKSIGGQLPTRVEQSLLYAKHKNLFREAAYWSCTEHESESGWAWYQYFSHGLQTNYRKDYELRARAVRRLPI